MNERRLISSVRPSKAPLAILARRNIYKTIAAVLADAGAALADVVRLQTFVTAREFCEPTLRVQGEIFSQIRPAAGIYVVTALLRPEMKVEIEATARIKRPA
jgi:enamine deaminase RidA (YjgF/YER057c/UK114 family)